METQLKTQNGSTGDTHLRVLVVVSPPLTVLLLPLLAVVEFVEVVFVVAAVVVAVVVVAVVAHTIQEGGCLIAHGEIV